MRRRTLAGPITQKNQSTSQAVPSADNPNSLTACALPVVIIEVELSKAAPRKIGIDIMGSDSPPSILLQAIESLLPESRKHGIELIAIGTPQEKSEVSFLAVKEFVSMGDVPARALKAKKNASLFTGLRLLKQKKMDAFLSFGNTGALVLGAKIILSMIPPFTRPALQALLPAKKGSLAVLDVGANVQYKASHLTQFAHMAAAYWNTQGVLLPRIGLLNIGIEPIKGPSELKNAYRLLEDATHPHFQFCGNIEGKVAFDGLVDALITDGFTGNIFLKTAEGVSNLIIHQIQEQLHGRKEWTKQLDCEEYPGALLLGVKGLVIKCHGEGSPIALKSAIRASFSLVRNDFLASFQKFLKTDPETEKS